VLWDGSKLVVDLYLGTCTVAACKGSERLFVQGVAGREQALDELGRFLRDAPPRSRFRVWLSAGLCRPLVLPPVKRASAKELETIATTLAPSRLGWSEPLAVRVDTARGVGSVAVVMQQRTLDDLLSVFDKARLRAASIQPWWAAALQEALRREGEAACVVVQDCDSICLLAGSGRVLDSAAVVSPTTDTAAAEAAVARLRFNMGIAAPTLIARLRIAADEPMTGDAGREALANYVEWSE
jgi:hypothetical protein